MSSSLIEFEQNNGDVTRVKPASGLPVVLGLAPVGSKITTEIFDFAAIAAATVSALGDCTVVDLSTNPRTLSLTVEVTYNAAATRGVVIHVRSSADNVNYDTIDWDTWSPIFTPGVAIRQTKNYDVDPYGIKVLVENLDPAQTITAVRVLATVGA
ncbi:MAG: hypothetical protein V1767_00950 [Chloroflexota bacterium]